MRVAPGSDARLKIGELLAMAARIEIVDAKSSKRWFDLRSQSMKDMEDALNPIFKYLVNMVARTLKHRSYSQIPATDPRHTWLHSIYDTNVPFKSKFDAILHYYHVQTRGVDAERTLINVRAWGGEQYIQTVDSATRKRYNQIIDAHEFVTRIRKQGFTFDSAVAIFDLIKTRESQERFEDLIMDFVRITTHAVGSITSQAFIEQFPILEFLNQAEIASAISTAITGWERFVTTQNPRDPDVGTLHGEMAAIEYVTIQARNRMQEMQALEERKREALYAAVFDIAMRNLDPDDVLHDPTFHERVKKTFNTITTHMHTQLYLRQVFNQYPSNTPLDTILTVLFSTVKCLGYLKEVQSEGAAQFTASMLNDFLGDAKKESHYAELVRQVFIDIDAIAGVLPKVVRWDVAPVARGGRDVRLVGYDAAGNQVLSKRIECKGINEESHKKDRKALARQAVEQLILEDVEFPGIISPIHEWDFIRIVDPTRITINPATGQVVNPGDTIRLDEIFDPDGEYIDDYAKQHDYYQGLRQFVIAQAGAVDLSSIRLPVGLIHSIDALLQGETLFPGNRRHVVPGTTPPTTFGLVYGVSRRGWSSSAPRARVDLSTIRLDWNADLGVFMLSLEYEEALNPDDNFDNIRWSETRTRSSVVTWTASNSPYSEYFRYGEQALDGIRQYMNEYGFMYGGPSGAHVMTIGEFLEFIQPFYPDTGPGSI